MKIVGAFEARNKLGSLLDLVEQGEEITITRHGKPAARLVAPSVMPGSERALQAVERIKERRKGVNLGGISIRELIDDGHR